MSISRTTFRIRQVTLTGPEAMSLTLLALRAVLPYCLIECIQLNRTKFQVNTSRYPRSIWQQLLVNKDWHPKLLFNLANSLAEEDTDKAAALRLEFGRLMQDEDAQVTIYGSVLYESDSTPDMLQAKGLPMAQSFGCELTVDAFTEFIKQTQRDKELEVNHSSQRELYATLAFSEPLSPSGST